MKYVSPFMIAASVGILAPQWAKAESKTTAAVSDAERNDVETRLSRFYSQTPNAMNDHIQKFSLRTKTFLSMQGRRFSSPEFNLVNQDNPLNRNAGIKSSKLFRQASCADPFHHFAQSPCATTDASLDSTAGDAVESKFQTLVEGWMPVELITYDLKNIPNSGEVAVHPWSDDYWALKNGGISYRLTDAKKFTAYKDAIADYAQPKTWDDLKTQSLANQQKAIQGWSAAEKYDFLVGDIAFGLTAEQKGEGQAEADAAGNVPDWIGICDGWSSAGIMVPSPQKPVDAVGVNNVMTHMTPSDIRALASLTWARGNFDTNTVGARCDTDNPETYPNGRLKEDQCADTNPATFHFAIGNMVGVAKKSFIMDASFDAEIWNQPIVSYHFTYFNPLDPSKRDADWTKVAVDYDQTFKAKDRFQTPLTRGVKDASGKWDDTGVKKVVGVIATVTYADEAIPSATDDAPDEYDVRVSYIYDLEFSDVSGHLFAKGGEWYNNTHPDFLWLPKVGTVSLADGDKAIAYEFDRAPTADVTTLAKAVSPNGAPACSVLSALVNQSAATGKYPSCGTIAPPPNNQGGGNLH